MSNDKNIKKFIGFICLIGACSILGSVKYITKKSLNDFIDSSVNLSHQLDNQTFCKQPTINEFPKDFIPLKEYKYSSNNSNLRNQLKPCFNFF
jgi:hypothetical protein